VEDRQRSRAAGIDYHLLKPVDHRDLLALLVQSESRSQGMGTADLFGNDPRISPA
jgi:hypothetical protein